MYRCMYVGMGSEFIVTGLRERGVKGGRFLELYSEMHISAIPWIQCATPRPSGKYEGMRYFLGSCARGCNLTMGRQKSQCLYRRSNRRQHRFDSFHFHY